MTELWIEKGYEHLGIKSQNQRDQASRLEKMDDSIGEICATDATSGFLKTVTTPVKMLIWTCMANFLDLHIAMEPPTFSVRNFISIIRIF